MAWNRSSAVRAGRQGGDQGRCSTRSDARAGTGASRSKLAWYQIERWLGISTEPEPFFLFYHRSPSRLRRAAINWQSLLISQKHIPSLIESVCRVVQLSSRSNYEIYPAPQIGPKRGPGLHTSSQLGTPFPAGNRFGLHLLLSSQRVNRAG